MVIHNGFSNVMFSINLFIHVFRQVLFLTKGEYIFKTAD